VAGDDPGDHEETKGDVAEGGIAHVFETFRNLRASR
jgi:hypothetical protein